MEQLEAHFLWMLPTIQMRLMKGDANMKKKYENEARLKGLGVSYIFAPGEEVMLKKFREGKLTSRA